MGNNVACMGVTFVIFEIGRKDEDYNWGFLKICEARNLLTKSKSPLFSWGWGHEARVKNDSQQEPIFPPHSAD